MDFLNLNKVYPKDCYSLPRINQLVDPIVEHQLISMIDSYQGYYQILITKEYQDKVSFITIDDTFCYVVMSFILKNARAKY